MTYKQKSQALHDMIFAGQLMDAFEKFYHQDVTMREIGEEPRAGKEVNRAYELKFLSMVKDVHGAGITAIASDEENGVVMIENWMDLTFQDGSRVKMEQVSVQKWDGDFIVHETFYHK
ncbi:MAG: nuclear transport factor 2 family protein [Bacteroidetes bacterium]|nr:nuclear transport factor 2 family protein [Bacteroidota bacterium]MBK8144158.1 nuclear transport factor 2 family protein [Bacteroidota bacterium]